MRSTPVIVRNVVLIACLALASSYGDPHSDLIELLGLMSGGLSAVNVAQFMDEFDPDMPGYEDLKANVAALVNQAEVTSSIEPVRESGDDSKMSVDLDWFLQARSLVEHGPIVERRQVVHCELRKIKKKWKIVSLKPLEFFAPAKLDK